MQEAANNAGGTVEAIVQAVDPVSKQQNVLVDDLLSALSAGLAFLAIPEAAALGTTIFAHLFRLSG